MPTLSRVWLAGLAGLLALVGGCTSDGHVGFLGYTTRPTYDTSIRTVYVPIFGNTTYLRGIEFEVTKALIREIESKTPYKVVSNRDEADTELKGTVVGRRKGVINANQLNEVREAELGIAVDVMWKDLRNGETLSVPNGMTRRDLKVPPGPVQIYPSATYIPELGGSNASAEALLARRLATQIVHMMEVWNVNCGQ